MIESDWKRMRNFHAWEAWGNWSLIDVRLVLELDKFRSFLNKKIVISCGTQKTHTRNSFHYQGLAVDVVIPRLGEMSFLDLFIAASRFDFHGIGLYPDWKYNGSNVPGLHLDCRQFSDTWTGKHRAHWLRVIDGDAKTYLPVKEATLRKFELIQGGNQ